MINPTPSDLGKFPVPPSGQPIPRGWFGRLVRFINSLILHGDGQYLTVKHTLDGQTITPTPALLQALGNGGAPPAAGGGADGIDAAVTGGTASITLSGGTGSVNITGTGAVTITKNTSTGDIEINATGGGGGGGFGFPDYTNSVWNINSDYPAPSFPVSLEFSYPVWLVGFAQSGGNSSYTQEIRLTLYPGTADQVSFDLFYRLDSDDPPPGFDLHQTAFYPISANVPFTLTVPDDTVAPDSYRYHIYGCAGASPLADYTVTRSSGTTAGTLFYGLSQQGDNTVSVDSSLNGTPLDFEGASVL